MLFDLKDTGASSAGAILKDSRVASVYGAFGDGCLRCYHIDIREKRTYTNSTVLRQVRSFVNDYGEDDALRIVDAVFNGNHNGYFRGQPIGLKVFSKGFRWMANELLLEGNQSAPNEAGTYSDGTKVDCSDDGKTKRQLFVK